MVDFTATDSWLVPTGVTSIDALSVGRGADGTGSSGGGGGASSQSTLAVTPGETLVISINSIRTRLLRGATQLLLANAGSGATGGLASAGIGTTKYDGGDASNLAGGGGAGSTGAGGDAADATPGTGNSPGGDGGANTVAGSNYGGGGGRGNVGGLGLVRITYTEPPNNASLTATLETLTLTGEATIPAQGVTNATMGELELTGAATLALNGSLAGTLGALTLTGEAIAGAGTGSVLATLGALTLSATGTNAVSGTLTATLDDLTARATGDLLLYWATVAPPDTGWSGSTTTTGIFDPEIFDPAIFDTGGTVWTTVTRTTPGWASGD
jgi:hypothetical protein